MGVDIMTYRARIGSFHMPNTSKHMVSGLHIAYKSVSCSLRLLLVVSLLIVLCGDVETNPGPNNGATPISTPAAPKPTKQRQLTLAQATAATSPDPRKLRSQAQRLPTNQVENGAGADVLEYLREMRLEVRNDLASIDNKLSDVNSSLNDLKAENEQLRSENKELWQEIKSLNGKMDKLEGQSRRNNLRFSGIKGSKNENWDETEQKLRTFIKHDLNMPDYENVPIERAHRLPSNNNVNPAIIAKFCNFKDREAILRKAKGVFRKDSPFAIHEDFTDRVRVHRRELGIRLVEERERGKYARMNFDKLIVENSVYGYDEQSKSIYRIGDARGRPGTKYNTRNGTARDLVTSDIVHPRIGNEVHRVNDENNRHPSEEASARD